MEPPQDRQVAQHQLSIAIVQIAGIPGESTGRIIVPLLPRSLRAIAVLRYQRLKYGEQFDGNCIPTSTVDARHLSSRVQGLSGIVYLLLDFDKHFVLGLAL